MVSFIHKPRHKLLVFGAGAVGLVLVGIAVGFVVLLSGAYSTAATTQHFRLTYRLLDLGLHYSVRSASRDLEAPALNGPGMIEHGAACYVKHCVQCHGAPGVAPTDEAKGLLPAPDPLAQTAREWPAPWLYYVTSKGVRMTGMPAWEYRISSNSLWATVAFLKQLPGLTSDQYQALQASVNPADCKPATESMPYSEQRAKITLHQYACDSCHIIEGVVGPVSYTGPALVDWSKRKYIAGIAPNTHENLVRWIRDPKAMSPRTLMPDLEVADAHAREMATYLMRLE